MTTMRRAPTALLAVLALAAGAATGCGGSARLLPAEQATRLDDQLQHAADRTLAGDCQGAMDALRDAQRTTATLPATIDPRLRDRIVRGLGSLTSTIPRDCRTATTPEPVTTDTTTDTTAATTDTTTDTTTTTTDTTPTTTTTTPTTTTTAPTTTTPVGGVSPDAEGQTP